MLFGLFMFFRCISLLVTLFTGEKQQSSSHFVKLMSMFSHQTSTLLCNVLTYYLLYLSLFVKNFYLELTI